MCGWFVFTENESPQNSWNCADNMNSVSLIEAPSHFWLFNIYYFKLNILQLMNASSGILGLVIGKSTGWHLYEELNTYILI